jgi:hypothetical protein
MFGSIRREMGRSRVVQKHPYRLPRHTNSTRRDTLWSALPWANVTEAKAAMPAMQAEHRARRHAGSTASAREVATTWRRHWLKVPCGLALAP